VLLTDLQHRLDGVLRAGAQPLRGQEYDCVPEADPGLQQCADRVRTVLLDNAFRPRGTLMYPIHLVIALTAVVAILAMTTVVLTVVIRAQRCDLPRILDMLIRGVRRGHAGRVLAADVLRSLAGPDGGLVEHLPLPAGATSGVPTRL